MVLAFFYARAGEPDKALDAARAAYQLAPEDPRSHLALVRAEVASNDLDGALASALALARQFPDLPAALIELGQVHIATRNPTAAIPPLRRAIELEPKNTDARAYLARALLDGGDYASALANAQWLAERESTSAQGHALAGDALVRLDRPTEAMASYRRAMQVGGTGPIVVQLARLQWSLGQRDAARVSMRDWLQANPDDLLVRSSLADAAYLAGDEDEARREWQHLVTAAPGDVLTIVKLATVILESGESGALEMSERAYELAPERPEVLDVYGRALFEQGNRERGVDLLERAVRNLTDAQRPADGATIRYHLATALAGNGEIEAAVAILEALMDSELEFPERAQARLKIIELDQLKGF